MTILRRTGIAVACLASGLSIAPPTIGAEGSAHAEETLVNEVAYASGTIRFSSLKGLNGKHVDIANRIASRFAAAGYGRQHQIAAVSVAIRESTLNPKAHNRGCSCYGLFQLNRSGGLGRGHSVATLTNPDRNIALIIGEANRFKSFRNAKSVDEAVSAFVRNVTRPGNKSKVTKATIRTARMVEDHARQSIRLNRVVVIPNGKRCCRMTHGNIAYKNGAPQTVLADKPMQFHRLIRNPIVMRGSGVSSGCFKYRPANVLNQLENQLERAVLAKWRDSVLDQG